MAHALHHTSILLARTAGPLRGRVPSAPMALSTTACPILDHLPTEPLGEAHALEDHHAIMPLKVKILQATLSPRAKQAYVVAFMKTPWRSGSLLPASAPRHPSTCSSSGASVVVRQAQPRAVPATACCTATDRVLHHLRAQPDLAARPAGGARNARTRTRCSTIPSAPPPPQVR